MVNTDMLKAIIAETGMTKKAVADKSGITRSSFYGKLDSRSSFTLDEVSALTKTLNLTKAQRDQIFFS